MYAYDRFPYTDDVVAQGQYYPVTQYNPGKNFGQIKRNIWSKWKPQRDTTLLFGMPQANTRPLQPSFASTYGAGKKGYKGKMGKFPKDYLQYTKTTAEKMPRVPAKPLKMGTTPMQGVIAPYLHQPQTIKTGGIRKGKKNQGYFWR